MFDQKLVNIKATIKNMTHDQSTFQSSFYEQKRTVKELLGRVAALEDEHEEVDIDALKAKQTIEVEDIINVMKTLKTDILREAITQTDLASIKEQMREIELGQDKI